MDLNQNEVLTHLRQINEYKFENFIADLWERQSWDTTVSQASNDQGIDVIAKKRNPIDLKHLIQVKRYQSSNKVGVRDIREYSSLSHRKDVDAVIIVTTSSFTRQAEKVAKEVNVKLIEGSDLYDIIVYTDSRDILEEYAKVSDTVVKDSKENPQQNERSGKSLERGVWKSSGSRYDGSNSSKSNIKSQKPVIDPDPTCTHCNSKIIWESGRNMGKCDGCGKEFKFNNHQWISLTKEGGQTIGGDSKCFIATAAYGTPKTEEIERLRDFRDGFLLRSSLGKLLVSTYYHLSPPLAERISRSNRRRKIVRRLIINPSLWLIGQFGY